MKISGFQKITLIDYPGKIACTLFLYGCNFRCGFCHNPELVIEKNENDISEKEVLNFLEKRTKYLDGVCFTGGEPLLTLDFDFVKKIKDMGYLVKLDTNGSLPEELKRFIDAGLIDYIAMDIKSLKDKYGWVTSSGVDVEKIEESIKLIAGSGLDYEFRTTIVPEIHDVYELKQMGEWLNELVGGKPKKFVLQGFKNQGKFIDEKYKIQKDIEEDFLKELKQEVEGYFEVVEIRV